MPIVSPKQYVMNVNSKSKGVLLDEFLHIIYKLKVYEIFKNFIVYISESF